MGAVLTTLKGVLMRLVVTFLFFVGSFSVFLQSPGNFTEGDFGNWSFYRVPFPPPSNQSVELIPQRGLCRFELRESDPYKSGSSRCELSVPPSFFSLPNHTEEASFSTLIPHNGIWLNPSNGANSTACVLGQWHAQNGESPPIDVRLLNSNELAVTVNTHNGRAYLYRGAVPYGIEFNLRFLIGWYGENGFLKVWKDNEMIVSYVGLMGESSPNYYFKYGIYNPTNEVSIPPSLLQTVYH